MVHIALHKVFVTQDNRLKGAKDYFLLGKSRTYCRNNLLFLNILYSNYIQKYKKSFTLTPLLFPENNQLMHIPAHNAQYS